ncbi:hypothetical protein HDU76_001951 [Blyttiomyces sp. JEL0837]|nr:hypothetical protein HDU76_001951 [Blyttiomyces sp. JEL0837]
MTMTAQDTTFPFITQTLSGTVIVFAPPTTTPTAIPPQDQGSPYDNSKQPISGTVIGIIVGVVGLIVGGYIVAWIFVVGPRRRRRLLAEKAEGHESNSGGEVVEVERRGLVSHSPVGKVGNEDTGTAGSLWAASDCTPAMS